MSKNTFYVSCPIDVYSGYSARSRDFVRALIELDKYDVKIISQRWGNLPFGFLDDNPEWTYLKDYIVPQVLEKPDIWCQITVPNEFQAIGKFNIGVTAGIETTVCAPQWIEGLNRMDLNLVSSTHSREVFEQSKFGMKDQQGRDVGTMELVKPLEVLMEGADLDVYEPHDDFENQDIYDAINSIPEKFAYLSVGTWMPGEMGESRKNLALLVKAFYETFKNKKKTPALILKTTIKGASKMDRREIQKQIDLIRKSVPATTLPSVYIFHGEVTNDEMSEIYNHPKVKAMVSLTKGEGFGRPLLEFSLVNKPIIVSGWSGHLDFLDAKFTTLLRGKLTPIHKSAQVKDMLIEGSEWFSPDLGHVGESLRNVFGDYKTYKSLANRQGYYSRTNFSFENMKEQLDGYLTQYVPDLPKKIDLKLPTLKTISLPEKIK